MATRLHVRWSGVQFYAHTGSWPIQPPIQWIAQVEHFGRATDHTTPFRTQVKNKKTYTSTCLYAFKVQTGTTSPFLSKYFKLTKSKPPHLHPSLVLEANFQNQVTCKCNPHLLTTKQSHNLEQDATPPHTYFHSLISIPANF
jgi:hypothetical protein